MSTALGPYSRTNNFVFDPSQVSGLALWLDAADDATVIRTGVNVTQWNDKSGNSRNFITTSGTPTYSASTGIFFSVTRFDIMRTNATLSYTSGVTTLFIVIRFTGITAGFAYAFCFLASNDNVLRYNGGLTFNANDIFNGQTWFLNGSAGGTSIPTTVFNNTTLLNGTINVTGTTTLQISSSFNGRYLTGFIQEVLIYSTTPSTTQREQVESYLAWKWNLQRNLPTTHPYYNSPYVAYNQIVNIPQRIFNNNTVFPNQISGLALWLDAADDATVIRTGSAVTIWNDKSGNIRNLTTVLSGPGTITYSNVSLVFSNTAYMFINTPVNLQNFTVFFIGKTLVTSGSANNQMIFCVRPSSGNSYNSADGLGLYYDYTATKQTRFYGTSLSAIQDAVTFVDPVLNCYTQNAAGSLSSFLYGSNTSNIATTARTTTTQGFAVGAQVVGGAYGTIGANYFQMNEVIVYNTVLSTTQRQQIEGYLAYKWNLKSNLPVTHPTYTPSFVPSGSISVKPYIWVPTQISGCALWLDAADANSVVRTGSNVARWNDKSGNVRDMITQGSSSFLNYTNYNNYNSIFFNNPTTVNNVYMANSNFSNPASATIFMVFAPLNNSRLWNFIYSWRPPNSSTFLPGLRVRQSNSNAEFYLTWFGQGTGSYPVVTTGNRTLLFNNYINTTNTPINISINGGTINSQNIGQTINQTVNEFNLGADVADSYANMYINEIVIYNNILTTTQRQQVEGYLAWKWGLQKSLPSSHPFFNFPQG